jgi:GT2 family glycosyltransferase
MVRRAAIDAVGLLDEAYFLYAEEMDWCYRMRQAGWEVAWLPAARCRHWGGQSSRQAQLQTPARLAGAACLFFKKHYGRGYVLLFRAGVVAVGVARALVYTVLYLGSRGQRVDWKHKTTANWRLAAAGWGPCESSI